MAMGYVSTGLGSRFSALHMFLMALHSRLGAQTPFGLLIPFYSIVFRVIALQSACHLVEILSQYVGSKRGGFSLL